MMTDPPRIIIQSELFKEHYLQLKKERTYRIEEWITGYEYTLPRWPKRGEMAGMIQGKEIFVNKQYDKTNDRYILIYHTYDDEKVIFFGYTESGK